MDIYELAIRKMNESVKEFWSKKCNSIKEVENNYYMCIGKLKMLLSIEILDSVTYSEYSTTIDKIMWNKLKELGWNY